MFFIFSLKDISSLTIVCLHHNQKNVPIVWSVNCTMWGVYKGKQLPIKYILVTAFSSVTLFLLAEAS